MGPAPVVRLQFVLLDTRQLEKTNANVLPVMPVDAVGLGNEKKIVKIFPRKYPFSWKFFIY